MRLQDVCTEKNFAYDTPYGKAYHYLNSANVCKTVFRYEIPFSLENELSMLARYNWPNSARLQFYKNLILCIQRQVAVSKHLSTLGVQSILTYSKVEKEKGQNGSSAIYLETEQVWPLQLRLTEDGCSYRNLLDIISRLAVILRDINKAPANVTHRGLDLQEVYINANGWVLLGGFYYADCDELGAYPDYLPERPPHIPEDLTNGGPGSHKTDIQTLSKIAWNLFSGLPYNAEWATKRMPVPQYALPELIEILLIGLAGEDEICNVFRRKLNDHRKQVAKTDNDINILSVAPRLKIAQISWVPSVEAEVK